MSPRQSRPPVTGGRIRIAVDIGGTFTDGLAVLAGCIWVAKTLTTGAEPWNIVSSPDGKRIFVANSGQDTITVINALNRTIIPGGAAALRFPRLRP